LPLDGAAARAAIDARVGRRLGLGVEEAAAGIVEIIDNSMARAIRTVSVGRGHDPRRFALVAFGGAGPLHACRLAELLEIPTVIIPPRPGVLSTWGLLDTDMRATFVRTVGTAERHLGEGPAAARGVDVKPLEATWGELEAQARAWLRGEPRHDRSAPGLLPGHRLRGHALLREGRPGAGDELRGPRHRHPGRLGAAGRSRIPRARGRRRQHPAGAQPWLTPAASIPSPSRSSAGASRRRSATWSS